MNHHEKIVFYIEVGAASFFFTALFLLFLANLGFIEVAKGIPFVSDVEHSWKITQVNGFEGIYINDLLMTPKGHMTMNVENNMVNTVEISEIALTNIKDTVFCKCSAEPNIVEPKNDFTITCYSCTGAPHVEGEDYKVQLDIREYYPETGILRTDAGIIEGYYRVD